MNGRTITQWGALAAAVLGIAAGARADQGFAWRGSVDNTVEIYIRGRQMDSRVVTGHDIRRERYDFDQALPRDNVRIFLNRREGRGRVTVFQQPDRNNGFTAGIRIEDYQNGSDDYAFTLAWDDRDDRQNGDDRDTRWGRRDDRDNRDNRDGRWGDRDERFGERRAVELVQSEVTQRLRRQTRWGSPIRFERTEVRRQDGPWLQVEGRASFQRANGGGLDTVDYSARVDARNGAVERLRLRD